MSNAIGERVYTLVADNLGVKRSKLTPNTTLSHDLGMEGDDAVEFFKDFQKEFSTDLKPLGKDWHSYFSAEGISPVAYIPGVLASVLFVWFFPRLPLWLSVLLGFLIGFVLLFGWIRLFGKKGAQITIQDLIDCAEAGRWTKTLPRNKEQRGLAFRIVK